MVPGPKSQTQATVDGIPGVERFSVGPDPTIGALGIVLMPGGRPSFMEEPEQSDLEDFRDTWGKDWRPLRGPMESRGWTALDAWLSSSKGEIADEAKCYLAIGLEDNLVGSFIQGRARIDHGADGPVFGDLKQREKVLVFRWPYSEIHRIELLNTRKLMKLWDEHLIVTGPHKSRLLLKAMTHSGGDRPKRAKPELSDFALTLAEAVKKSRDSDAGWEIETETAGEIGETHRILLS